MACRQFYDFYKYDFMIFETLHNDTRMSSIMIDNIV